MVSAKWGICAGRQIWRSPGQLRESRDGGVAQRWFKAQEWGVSEGHSLAPPFPTWAAELGEPGANYLPRKCGRALIWPGELGIPPLFFSSLNKILKQNAFSRISRNTRGPSAFTASHPQPALNFSSQPPTLHPQPVLNFSSQPPTLALPGVL